MREIKFRIWDAQSKKFAYFNLRRLSGHWSATILDPEEPSSFRGEEGIAGDGSYSNPSLLATAPVLQYTGLKDKNGVEIYEGDVVISSPKQYLDTPTVVEWDGWPTWDSDGMFAMWSGYWHSYAKPEDVEVIGNIYETPDLIKGEGDDLET